MTTASTLLPLCGIGRYRTTTVPPASMRSHGPGFATLSRAPSRVISTSQAGSVARFVSVHDAIPVRGISHGPKFAGRGLRHASHATHKLPTDTTRAITDTTSAHTATSSIAGPYDTEGAS